MVFAAVKIDKSRGFPVNLRDFLRSIRVARSLFVDSMQDVQRLCVGGLRKNITHLSTKRKF
jgi:hypothetical protein